MRNVVSEPGDVELLVAFLDGRSVPCPVCGYDLRDLRNDRCPECGRVLRLAVREDRPVHAPFIVGLIAFAAPLGASLCAVSGLCYWRIKGTAGWDFLLRPLVLNILVLALAIPALALWVRYARLLRRQSVPRQWAWAAGACAATLVGHVIFLVMVW
jgi:hypothetical protein